MQTLAAARVCKGRKETPASVTQSASLAGLIRITNSPAQVDERSNSENRTMSVLQPELEDVQKLLMHFRTELGGHFQVEMNVAVEGILPIFKERFDIVIQKDGNPLAVLEYKSIVFSVQVNVHPEWLIERFKKVGIQFGILYFGRKEEFFLYNKGKYGLTKMSFESIISAIQSNHAFGLKPLVDDVAAEILSCMPDELSKEKDISIHQKLYSLFSEDTLYYDDEKGEVSFVESSEDKFFCALLPQDEPKSLCRYTTLNGLFLTLKDKKNCMCSLTCMNDKGEISYADKYIHYGVYAYSPQIIDENNDSFILSCCDVDKVDDLTMWRLYGDQGKGVCLEYNIDSTKVDNERFFLAPVSYGVEKNKHPQLDFIKNINQWEKNGWRFKLKRWQIWKHFFKSYLFMDEHEFRLLFFPSVDDERNLRWIMDSTNSIVSRIALFGVDEESFPLRIKSILVGPKCPEQESNVDQLEFMNRKQGVIQSNIMTKVVRASNITDYR